MATIIYTYTDEAPRLATYSFLPIVSAYAEKVGVEVETRDMRGPRLIDSSGIPLHPDNQTVVKEKLYLDPKDPDILRNEITTYDHAFTQPWTVSRFYRREHKPMFAEYNCTEDNPWLTIGSELYMKDAQGYVMPIQKDQPPPDQKYFQKYWPAKK